jgi:DnaJ-class molecular chaperone
MKDYYYILGINRIASTEEIKNAYRKLSKKFHPDTNNGDDFFADRFKEIQEAYETLRDSKKKEIYDKEFSFSRFNENPNNDIDFEPIINYFNVNKLSFKYDEEVTFYWKTTNSDEVLIKPFGSVQKAGQKTFRLKDFKNSEVNFEIIAKNKKSGYQKRQILTLENKTFHELYSYFKKIIEFENFSKQEKNEDDNKDYRKNTQIKYVKHNTDKGIIEIEPCRFLKGKRAFLDGSPAPDGKYKFGFLWYVQIKNGVVVKE